MVRTIVVLIIVACSLPAAKARADRGFSLADQDKQAHVAVSYGLTLTGSLALRRLGLEPWQAAAASAAATLVIGGVKELVIDNRQSGDHASGGDMVANLLGVAGAVGVYLAFTL